MTEVLLFDSLPADLRADLSNGVTRTYCPRCDGGTTRERSLDCRQADTGVLKLKCYRASCGWFGISVTEPDAQLQRKSIKPPTVFRDPIMPIRGKIDLQLILHYQLDNKIYEAHGWGMSERGDQLIMPVRDPYGNERGHVTRTFEKVKRCYTFKATAQPWLDHWREDREAPTVIVEDCISAARLHGLGFNAVALLGTSMTVDQAKEIRDNCYGYKCYLALDNDAFEKSLHMTKRHAHILQMRPVLLLEDIKAMQFDEDIKRLFP